MNLFVLSNYNVAYIISILDVQSLCAFDSAICNREYRELFLKSVREIKVHEHKALDGWLYSISALKWIISRRYSPRDLQVVTGSHYLFFDGIDFSILKSIGLQKSKFFMKSIHLPQSIQISDHDLNFIHDCPQLTSIDLQGCQGITNAGLRLLGDACPQLESINLRNCRSFSDNGISDLARKCSKLKDVNVISCNTLTDHSISILAQLCPLLQSIRLDHSRTITAQSMVTLGQECPQLQNITLNCCINLTEDDLLILVKCCPNLKSITLSYSKQVSEHAVAALRVNMPQLHIIADFYFTNCC